MIERLLRTLFHPRLVMTALATLALHTGVVSLTFRTTLVHFPTVWAVAGISAGLLGLLAVAHPTRFLVALSGSLVVCHAVGRGFAVAESFLTERSGISAVRGSALIAVGMWLTIGFVSLVVWRRLVVPWSVLAQVDRSDRRHPEFMAAS